MINKVLTYEESHKEINGELHKICKICEEWFPCTTEYFYKKKSNKLDGVSSYCKHCETRKNVQWGKDNRDKRLGYLHKNNRTESTKMKKYLFSKKQKESGYSKEWQQNNPEKLKQYGERYSNKAHKINKKEWTSCKEYFNNECAYCGLPLDKHYNKFNGEVRLTDLHKEHVDCNGSDDLSNCIPSCKDCNSSKHNSKLEDWYNENNPNYNIERLNKIYKWTNEDYKLYIQEHKTRRKRTQNNTIHIEDSEQLNI